MTNETNNIPQGQQDADNRLEMDITSVKNLQIGYHAETIYLRRSPDDRFIVEEYIGGLSGSEYYAKVTANRIKTTIRYGRREEVNRSLRKRVPAGKLARRAAALQPVRRHHLRRRLVL